MTQRGDHLALIRAISVAKSDDFFLAGQALQTRCSIIKTWQKILNSVCPGSLQWENKQKNAGFPSFFLVCGRERYVSDEKTRG